jgi:hypothetical protein
VTPRRLAAFGGAIAASLLPSRLWRRLPSSWPMAGATFASGLITLLLAAAIGIRGFLDHAQATSSLGLDAELHRVFTNPDAGYRQGMVQGFAGLAIFTFLLLTPKGWLTLYLAGSGSLRMAAAWFDDALGDPLLTAIHALVARGGGRWRARAARNNRDALEGPAVADRVVSSSAAGIPGCDVVVVASRRKPGWERGVAVFTPDGCYRLGEPVEQTIAGRLRTLYPLSEHADLEAIRRSVNYDVALKEPRRS